MQFIIVERVIYKSRNPEQLHITRSSYKNQRRGRAAQWADVAAIILLCNFVCACSKMASWTNPTIQSKIAWRDDDVVVSVPMKSGTTWYVSHRFVALAHFFIIASS